MSDKLEAMAKEAGLQLTICSCIEHTTYDFHLYGPPEYKEPSSLLGEQAVINEINRWKGMNNSEKSAN